MKSSTRSALLAMTTVFLWSSAFPITKIAAQAFTPNALGLFRCSFEHSRAPLFCVSTKEKISFGHSIKCGVSLVNLFHCKNPPNVYFCLWDRAF